MIGQLHLFSVTAGRETYSSIGSAAPEARRSDPETSHAAASMAGRLTREHQRMIVDALRILPEIYRKPRDEADELRRQVLAMGRDLQRALDRIEQIERVPVRLGPREAA